MADVTITAALTVTSPTFSAATTAPTTGADVHYAVAIIDPATDLNTFTVADILDAYDGSVAFADVPRSSLAGKPVAIVTDTNLGIYTVTASGACPPTSPQPEYGEQIVIVTANTANDPATLVAWGADLITVTDYRPVRGDGGGGASLSDATPAALGTAAAGTGTLASRDDHVHAMPSASEVGAAASDDARLSDARTPTAHKTSHATGGTDALTASDIGAVPTSRTINGQALTSDLTIAAGDTTRRILIPTNQTDRASAGIAWNADAGSSVGWGYLAAATGSINDYAEWDVWIPAGTWTLIYYYLTGSSYGITTLSLDGTTLGATIDGYTSGSVRNNVATRTGIVVATAGVKVLKVLMASKNASASAYKSGAQLFDLRRTA